MTYNGGADYDRAGRVIYYLAVTAMAFVIIYAVIRPRTPDLANSKAFGCYTTDAAPAILLNQQGMTIFEKAPIRIGFHLERHKTGIALTADAPIAAEPDGTRFMFSIKPPGEGWYLNFFNVIDGRSYGVFDENGLRQFTMLARDGTQLPYRKATENNCQA